MSELEVSLTQQEMEANGELDFIRAHVAAAQGEGTPTPAGAETVVEDEVDEVDDSEEEEIPADVGTEATAESEDDVLYLDIDDATQQLIDSKYGGDLNKALSALRESQSVIGRQGNEMGALRTQLEQAMDQLRGDLLAAQPYADWPDEFDEPSAQAAQFRQIAEQAFDRRDPAVFGRAITAWEQADPVSAGLYRDLKEMQVRQIEAAAQAPVVDDEATLEAEITAIVSEIPQFQVESFQSEVAAELDKTPSLKAVLWGQVPGVSVDERATILREAAQRVIARNTSETVTAARKRIAIRTSEEARQARVDAKVSRAASARDEEVETPKRTMPMGDTGRVLDIDRLNSMLSPEDRI